MKEIKELSGADYENIFLLSQFAFQYELSEAELEKKKKEAARHKIWGWMVNDQLAAKLHLIPLSTYVSGREFKTGGISSVATWPEYRRQGMVKHLLKHALIYMKENGQSISFLHPFSVPFYRKYGWELTFTNHHDTIPLKMLKKDWQGNGYVRRDNIDLELLHSIYTTYAKRFTGMLVRDEKWWEQRVLKGNWHIAVAYNEDDHADGYIIYDVKENIFRVKEMAHKSLNGKKLLLQFIANHDSMAKEVQMTAPENDNLPLLVDDPLFEQKVEPYFMARIVDVAAFVNKYPFRENVLSQTLSLHVEDTFFPENSGTYNLNQTDSQTKVAYAQTRGIKDGIYCTIQQLTVMMLGYKRPMDLFYAGLIQGEREEIMQLEKIIPLQQTFLADFY